RTSAESWVPDQDPRDLARTLDLCLRVGEVLLSSGAGAADVTATMRVVAQAYGVRNPAVDVTFTQLAMGAQTGPDETPVLQMRGVTQRDIDYEDLTRVDQLVREVAAGKVDVTEARARVARIVSSGHARHRWAVTLGWGVMCAGVGLQLGGTAAVVAVAFVAAVAIDRLQLVMSRARLPFFYRQIAGGALATLIAAVATRAADPWVHMDASAVVSANIIMLLSGIGFMGAIQDALSGFYVTGGARLLEAVLATAGVIGGVTGGLSLAAAVHLELPSLVPARTDLTGIGVAALGGAIGSAAFAFSAYAPRRALVPIGILGAAALAADLTIALHHFAGAWSVGVAAFGVGLVSFAVAGRLRVPPLVVVVPAIVPMLPGLSIYQGLSLLGASDHPAPAEGLLAMVAAGSIAIALAAGVILGEYVAQPVAREARRVPQRLAGPRLVGVTRLRRRRSSGAE
ncbi:MAG TPA: threonine/serine exporter family protein, partial [Nocardioides sp.]|nr:threonine/serine exporter family protein [Nocardioides sp.]